LIIKTILSSWWEGYGHRLDCQPYLAGALEARIILERLPVEKVPLKTLTTGHEGGIYNGPQFARRYVLDPMHGVPFLTGSSIQVSDLSRLPLLSKRDALSKRLSFLKLVPRTTLISCSGTIGKMSYARAEMEQMWSSQDVLKVVPDPKKVSPGYLYAYLSSKFGIPLVVSGTYGAIIQHIEPQHVADLPVPRLRREKEKAIGARMDSASEKLSKHSLLMRTATETLMREAGLQDVKPNGWNSDCSRLSWEKNGISSTTLRALNFDPRARRIDEKIRGMKYDSLGDLCEKDSFRGKTIFKRIESAPEYGALLIGQKEAFQVRPEGRWISRASIQGLGLQVPAGTTLIASHGTLGEFELYCRAAYVTTRTSEFAFSGDFYRCIPRAAKILPGYLYAFLRSETAFRLLRTMSTGGKQQSLHPLLIYSLPIPRLAKKTEEQVAAIVQEAAECFDAYLIYEEEAWKSLETELLQEA
jgi:restriction endonuclease S subunit